MTDAATACLSSYLAFRYLTEAQMSWKPGVAPAFPSVLPTGIIGVATAGEIRHQLAEILRRECHSSTGILLSGGIDSAILAALVPAGTPAYTIRFIADGAMDEVPSAARFARQCNLEHVVVDVDWNDYQRFTSPLMKSKSAPLHAVEPALYKAACAARDRGITSLILGNGADSTFGGLDKLLGQDWPFDAFVKRYAFVNPGDVLRNPTPIEKVFEPYRDGGGIRVLEFLKEVHGRGIIQAFDNAIGAAGCSTVEPYEKLTLTVPLDLPRVRSGESKYLLREVFANLYPGMQPPTKVAFARPMDRWLRDWKGPDRKEFLPALDMQRFTGDQKWLIYCLEQFLVLLDSI